MGILFQIAKNTFRECLREPVYLLNLLSTLVLIGILPPLATLFVFRNNDLTVRIEEQTKMITDSGMAAMLVAGWVAAVLAASHAISREIANGTALLMMSKPVNRVIFVSGKMLGILGILTVFCYLSSIAVLLAVQVAIRDNFHQNNTVLAILFGAIALGCVIGALVNYVNGSSFCMNTVCALLVTITLALIIVYLQPQRANDAGRLYYPAIPALFLMMFAVFAMGMFATAMSTRFDTIANLMCCTIVFMVGLVSDYALGGSTLSVSSLKLLSASEGKSAKLAMDVLMDRSTRTGYVFRISDTPAPLDLAFDMGQTRELKTVDCFFGPKWDIATQKDGILPKTKVVYQAWLLPSTPAVLEKTELPKTKPDVTGIMEIGNASSGRISFFGAAQNKGRCLRLVLKPAAIDSPMTFGEVSIRETKGFLAEAVYALIPNWQFFWMADALASEVPIPWSYVGNAALYVLVLSLIFSVMGVMMFQYREVGTGQMTE
jgi:ABC-type transport system involved in multi-copper enzyme maturation permease subunit